MRLESGTGARMIARDKEYFEQADAALLEIE